MCTKGDARRCSSTSDAGKLQVELCLRARRERRLFGRRGRRAENLALGIENLLHRDPVVSRRRSQTLALDPGQRPLDEESWAGASVGLERSSEVGAATPAQEELREIGVQLLGSVALAAGFTERDGVVSAQLEEQGPESDE